LLKLQIGWQTLGLALQMKISGCYLFTVQSILILKMRFIGRIFAKIFGKS